MTDVYLIDPDPSSVWFPYQHSRPVSELRAGAWLIRERWEAIADGPTRAIFAPSHLQSFVEDGIPRVGSREPVTGPAIVGRSVFAPSGERPALPRGPATLVHEGKPVGWWVPEGNTWEDEQVAWEEVETEGILLHGAYDLVSALEHFLVADVADFVRESGDPIPDGCIVIGDPQDVVLLGAVVEPGVTFDTRDGAIVVEQHSYVRGGTRLIGPVYVGPGTQVLGGEVGWSAIGPRCKVRGEIVSVVFLGYGNKGHDGFVGHSVIGRWANLGAGTTTSNLKNTYGPVRLDLPGGRVETGRQFLGSLIGDHAKTAIGTMLSTGSAVGVGANVFGWRIPPKYVPPFAWGSENTVMDLAGFLRIAERVMPRRKVEVTDDVRKMLEGIYRVATAR